MHSKKCKLTKLQVASCVSPTNPHPLLDFQKVGRKLQKGREKPIKSREKIVALFSEDGKLSAMTPTP